MSQAPGSLPGSGKRRGGAITFWIGVVLGLGSLALALITGWMSYTAITGAVEDSEPVNGDTTVTLQADDVRTIYQVEQGGQQADCTVTGPDGEQLTLSRTSQIEGSSGDTTYVNVGNFTAKESGEHRIVCEGPRAFVGPDFSVTGVVGGIFGVLAGIGGILLGGLLAIVGAILWFVGRGESKRALAYSPGGYGSGGYQQGGYGQGGPPPPPPPTQ